ncbi:MAG TPA: DUF4304 domain-containing protein [Myxococcaceae bacterium]|nr:DUF4304 domain-containing protein [Myxococcaceae bacterium]
MNTRKLKAILSGQLAGFVAWRSAWYRQTPAGLLQAVELQKSAWGGQFAINVALMSASEIDTNSKTWPVVNQFDVIARIEQLSRDERVTVALDLEARMSDEERQKLVEGAIEAAVLPFFKRLNSSEAMRAAVRSGELDAFAVRARLREDAHGE